MITSVLFLVGGVFISLFVGLLSLFSYAIPDVFETSIQQYLAYFGYAQGLVPVVATSGYSGLAGSIGLLDLFGYALVFIGFWYLFKLLLMLFAMIPFIGKHIPLPHSGGKEHSK